MQEGVFRLSWAASWRLHALNPGPEPPSHSFYSSKVCSPAALLDPRVQLCVCVIALCLDMMHMANLEYGHGLMLMAASVNKQRCHCHTFGGSCTSGTRQPASHFKKALGSVKPKRLGVPWTTHVCYALAALYCARLFPQMHATLCLRASSMWLWLRQSKVKRRHLRLAQQHTIDLAEPEQQQHQQQGGAQADTFTTMLTNLVHSRTLASQARAVGMLSLLQLALRLVVSCLISVYSRALSCPHANMYCILAGLLSVLRV